MTFLWLLASTFPDQSLPSLFLPTKPCHVKDARKYGNIYAQCLLGLYLAFNGPDARKGTKYIAPLRKDQLYVSRYIYAMALFNTNRAWSGAHNMQALLEAMDFDRHQLRQCRLLFREMLLPHKYEELRVTRFSAFIGIGYWFPRTGNAILSDLELDIDCPFCMINVETYKMLHAIE